MASTTFEKIQDAKTDFFPLHERMDGDKDLYNLLEFELRDLQTGEPLTDVVNMTMNDPKVFADRAQAFMNEATMQRVAEGKNLQDSETTIIENFDEDIHYEIDQDLMFRDIVSLYSFLIEQSVVRGTLAGRLISWDDKGKFRPDFLNCDSRYLLYEYGRRDLDWGAFQTIRSRASIVEEYPRAEKLMPSGAKRGAIWEHWDKKVGEIWLSGIGQTASQSGDLLDEKENIFGYPPFIIQTVGAGSMLQDEGAIAYKGESIFANNRLLYPQLNTLATVLQTLNLMTFTRPYNWESDAGVGTEKPPETPSVGARRETYPIDKGTKGLFPVPVGDIQNATRLFYALILGALQRGSLPNIDYGNLTFPLSAVAISKLTATKDAIFSPRLQAISLFYRKLHYMVKDQYIKGGYEAELGEEGLERKYSVSDLDKKYKIGYKFHAVSPEQDIANYAIAQQALAIGVSKITVYTDIVKFKDPHGEIMKGDAEKARQLDPVILLFDHGHALIDQGTERSFLKAELIADKIERLLRQEYAPALPAGEEGQIPELSERGKQPKGLVDLLGAGGGGGGGSQASEEDLETAAPEETLQKEERRSEVVRKNQAEG